MARGSQSFNERLKSGMHGPQAVAIKFSLAALVCVCVFRFIYPDFDSLSYSATGYSTPLLDIFWFKARLVSGILTYIEFFPAVFMAALTLPFALKVYESRGDSRFQTTFFESLRPHLMTGIAGTLIYALLSLVVSPLLNNYTIKAQRESILYSAARERAEAFAKEEKWVEASGFFAVCDRIWPQNDALSDLEGKISSGMERLRYSRAERVRRSNALGGIPGQPVPVNAAEALALAKRALAAERYYDAHWLSNTAESLAREGSVEAADAARTASLAWNAIARLEPSEDEKLLYSIYKRKREGYEALISGEWLRAYYIFNALIKDAPSDPDVRKYLTMSEAGLETVAFFLDEMDLAIGDIESNAVFSLPNREDGLTGESGRIVFRIEALTTFEDVSYGRGLEAIGFSARNEPLFRVSAQSVKIMPISISDSWQTVLLLRAVDRENEAVRQEPLWGGATGGSGAVSGARNRRGGSQLLLSIQYEDFLLASAAQSGADGFFLNDLWTSAKRLEDAGFVPQVFETEILRQIAEPALFPAVAVLALVIGWKYRSLFRVRYSIYPMLIVLPMVFSMMGALLRSLVRSGLIWTLLSFGFAPALVSLAAASILSFALSVFLLAAQRN